MAEEAATETVYTTTDSSETLRRGLNMGLNQMQLGESTSPLASRFVVHKPAATMSCGIRMRTEDDGTTRITMVSGLAADAGLKEGMQLQAVGGIAVTSAAQAVAFLKEATGDIIVHASFVGATTVSLQQPPHGAAAPLGATEALTEAPPPEALPGTVSIEQPSWSDRLMGALLSAVPTEAAATAAADVVLHEAAALPCTCTVGPGAPPQACDHWLRTSLQTTGGGHVRAVEITLELTASGGATVSLPDAAPLHLENGAKIRIDATALRALLAAHLAPVAAASAEAAPPAEAAAAAMHMVPRAQAATATATPAASTTPAPAATTASAAAAAATPSARSAGQVQEPEI